MHHKQTKKRTSFKIVVFTVLLFCANLLLGQYKYEREHRILKAQFPENALGFIVSKLNGAKRIRFYKEIDSARVSYEAKFKKDRLWYSIEFDQAGELEDIEITINPVDMPNEVFKNINAYLVSYFQKSKIKKIQQQYVATPEVEPGKTLNNAFQNLMLPSINYEIIVAGKKGQNNGQYELLFNAAGDFKSIRESLPPNYDHVLY